jgi:Kdo2-lipid IVA lauroyltransferase/acyltransferase
MRAKMMDGRCYSFRRHLLARERTYRIGTSALHWKDGSQQGSINFNDVKEVRLYRRFMRGKAAVYKKVMWNAYLNCRSNQLVLSPLHYVQFCSWEDRSAHYQTFANLLFAKLRASNPNLTIVTQQHWTMRLRQDIKRRVISTASSNLVWMFRLIRNWDPDRTVDAAARLTRVVGPWLRHHRVARANLQGALTHKSPQEVEEILKGVWDNCGRVIAEYVFLDRLWDYDPVDRAERRISLDPILLERVGKLRNSGTPVLFFGAHLANWELPAIAAAALGLKSAMVYRQPNFGALADQIIELRANAMGQLIAARSGAALQIRSALRRGNNVAMLVDQHSVGGVEVIFFGRACKVNPTLARLARRFDLPIHGARAVRLPNHCFRLELTDALQLPRDRNGKIEIAAAMQMITSIIEQWVRENPDQWLWMHRRWR